MLHKGTFDAAIRVFPVVVRRKLLDGGLLKFEKGSFVQEWARYEQ